VALVTVCDDVAAGGEDVAAGGEDVAAGCGTSRACGAVQPATVNVTAQTVSTTAVEFREQAREISRINAVTDSPSRQLTNA
jgi:hypothetical protein